jgi:putative isomerase
MTAYDDLQHRLARGWNTWNTRSILSHVLLPEGFALNLGLKEYRRRRYLGAALIGRRGEMDEQIVPGPRTYDGSYTELTLTWRGVEVLIQTAALGPDDGDLVVLVTPNHEQRMPPLLVVESAMLWNRPGELRREGNVLIGNLPERTIEVYGTWRNVEDPYIPAKTPYLAMPLDRTVGLSTGIRRTIGEIRVILEAHKADHDAHKTHFDELVEVYAAIQTCMAWDTVYDPENDRVISPVSRMWNVNWGGFVLFDWDTYFAAYLAGIDNRDLAYANAIEITREQTERGFIPNFGTVRDIKSRDRSQPPVGSLVVRELYRIYGDRWFLEEIFDDLLTWNRWWVDHRACPGGLCWGSNPYTPVADAHFEIRSVNDSRGAALESGLDNSPMYDDIPFDAENYTMALTDVGLMGMYIMDCEALADIAGVLGREEAVVELRDRAGRIRTMLQELWHEPTGLFLNRRTDTGERPTRLSPTHFYPLMGRAPTQDQASRMVKDHLTNPEEFWGEWVLPSIARDDPAYPDQDYWRGRIWAPMNFLVYLGLRHYDLPEIQAALAAKSRRLLLKEWRAKGHVHENYSAETGEGCDVRNSDRFYHWGGLLGLIALIEAGYVPPPEQPLDTTES